MKRISIGVVLALTLAACGGVLGPAAPPGPSVRTVDNETDFVARLLRAHNAERERLGQPPLAWSPALADHAEIWARHLARRGAFEHAPRETREGQGENLFTGTAGAYPLEQMMDGFLGERRDFTPGVFPEVSRTGRWEDVGHYTQIIWPGTREVGCSLATGRGRDTLVCRYSPAGNVVGQRVP
jgi:hypothetical protein